MKIFVRIFLFFLVAQTGYAGPVALHFAKAYIQTKTTSDGRQTRSGVVEGYIEVENLAYQKQVTVLYYHSESWQEKKATFLKKVSAAKEIWAFTISGLPLDASYGFETVLAFKYQVGSNIYWDNHGGKNHRLGIGPRIQVPHTYIGDAMLQVDHAVINFDDTDTARFFGAVLVRNAAYKKSVVIQYTEDNWTTLKESEVFYQTSMDHAIEIWAFDIRLNNAATKMIEFKVLCSYDSDIPITDDNYERNYKVAVPGRLR